MGSIKIIVCLALENMNSCDAIIVIITLQVYPTVPIPKPCKRA